MLRKASAEQIYTAAQYLYEYVRKEQHADKINKFNVRILIFLLTIPGIACIMESLSPK